MSYINDFMYFLIFQDFLDFILIFQDLFNQAGPTEVTWCNQQVRIKSHNRTVRIKLRNRMVGSKSRNQTVRIESRDRTVGIKSRNCMVGIKSRNCMVGIKSRDWTAQITQSGIRVLATIPLILCYAMAEITRNEIRVVVHNPPISHKLLYK